ncbi:hypothetical protein V5N11_025434 [Cardamine amara subsp. amara]|uniref:Reverse transcriptase zinc-binding domain-containing protein n=1 Tax=Cardamine amara subsp. amara TaxID=228776 RepID=A0ABD0Z0H8_CARAN
MRGRMTTRDRLITWGLQVSRGCLLCNEPEESSDHLFFTYLFSQEVWCSLMSHPSLNPPLVFSQIVQWITKPSSLPKLNTICSLVLQATVYEVWRERNARIHGATHRRPGFIIRDIQLTIRSKLACFPGTSLLFVQPFA